MVRVSGSLLQSFTICKRQAWLMAHNVVPDQEHPYIELGRLIDETTYEREKKKLQFENVVIDVVQSRGGRLVIGEVKKSSRAEKSARLQLAFYLYLLKERGIQAEGVLMFPEERRRTAVKLTPELVKEIELLINQIQKLCSTVKPPAAQRISYCGKCGYREFCWS